MTEPLIFISYKHEEPYADFARRFHLKLKPVAQARRFELFFDKTMEAGKIWRAEVREALERTTHLVAFVCDEYWDSEECKLELHTVLGRYEAAIAAGQVAPRLLFVKAGEMNPSYLTFDEARRQGALSSTDARIGKLADVNFLGPFDLMGVGRLEVLTAKDHEKRDEQLGQLRERLLATLD